MLWISHWAYKYEGISHKRWTVYLKLFMVVMLTSFNLLTMMINWYDSCPVWYYDQTHQNDFACPEHGVFHYSVLQMQRTVGHPTGFDFKNILWLSVGQPVCPFWLSKRKFSCRGRTSERKSVSSNCWSMFELISQSQSQLETMEINICISNKLYYPANL